jgi:ABC-2 type transport system ATP-binding protein
MKYALIVHDLEIRRNQEFDVHIQRLKVRPGTIICFAGANGSGKTTLLESLVGLLTPRSGSIAICGHNVGKYVRTIKQYVGFIPDDEQWLIEALCAEEYFKLLKKVYIDVGMQASELDARISSLSKLLNFTEVKQKMINLSHGNKKKVQIIAGLMHRPKVIVIDELRNGLDPIAIIAAEKIITQAANEGAAVIAATHDLWWAERLATEVAILANGRIRIHDNTQVLLEKYGSIEQLFIHINETRHAL